MDRQRLLYAAVGLAVGAVASFLFANAANRRELDELRAELARVRTQSEGGAGVATSGRQTAAEAAEQVSELVRQADANPADAAAQRQAGERVYRYALTTGQAALLSDAVRLLRRAHEADPKDYDTLLLLGNSHLTLGLANDPASFAEARGYYLKALQSKPGDVNAHTLLGMTYYYGRPSDPASAAREYRKALAGDPSHEMALQNLAAALIATGEVEEASRRIDELGRVNPSNKTLDDLRDQLAEMRGRAKERR